jgi:hypothetical protein
MIINIVHAVLQIAYTVASTIFLCYVICTSVAGAKKSLASSMLVLLQDGVGATYTVTLISMCFLFLLFIFGTLAHYSRFV